MSFQRLWAQSIKWPMKVCRVVAESFRARLGLSGPRLNTVVAEQIHRYPKRTQHLMQACGEIPANNPKHICRGSWWLEFYSSSIFESTHQTANCLVQWACGFDLLAWHSLQSRKGMGEVSLWVWRWNEWRKLKKVNFWINIILPIRS